MKPAAFAYVVAARQPVASGNRTDFAWKAEGPESESARLNR